MRYIFKNLVLFIILFSTTTQIWAQDLTTEKLNNYRDISEKIVRSALIENKGYRLLEELCKIGHRLSGTENSLKAINWAKLTMDKMNFDNVWLQKCMVPHWERGNIEKAIITNSKKYNGKSLSIAALGGSIGTTKSGVTGEIIEVQNFEELKKIGEKAKGKIIFFNRSFDMGTSNTFAAYAGGVNQRGQGAIEAAKVGGIAVIVRSMTSKYDNVPHTGIMYYIDSLTKIPAVSIGLKDADLLSEAIKNEPDLKIRLDLSCENLPEAETYNVICDLKGSEYPNEIIVLGGHFDCWDKGVGAHDDGAGCIQALETLELFKRLGIKPKRTIRCVFFANEESGSRGGLKYGVYTDTSKEIHLAAIEADRGALTPRGFYTNANIQMVAKMQDWLPALQNSGIEWIRPGGTGSDISPIKKCKALFGYAPDIQRYFDFHHSENDVFAEIHPREFELGSAAMAILAYLLSEEGL
jgi:carboxypeptidase Q